MIDKLKKISLAFLFVATLAACSKPQGVLSEEDMAYLLVDIHIAESSLRIFTATPLEKQSYFNSIFDKHGVTKAIYDSSLVWYSQNPEEYVLVYDLVLDSMTRYADLVEDYVFHPDERPTYLDSIDTINIWFNEYDIEYSNQISKRKRRREFEKLVKLVDFEFVDTNYFAVGDKYRLLFTVRVYNEKESPVLSNASFYIHYSDSIIDSVTTCIKADSIQRTYILPLQMPDSIKAQKISGCLIDNMSQETLIEIDTIALQKIYQFYNNPLPRIAQNVVDSIENSKRKAEPLPQMTMEKPLIKPSK